MRYLRLFIKFGIFEISKPLVFMKSINNDQFKIYLADDDEDDCMFFREALEDLGLSAKFYTFRDGEDLLATIGDGSKEFPDVLFLDLNMPLKNGLECLLDLKNKELLNKLKVFIYSTSKHERTIKESYQTGAFGYIQKPAEYSKLKNVIKKALERVTWNGTNVKMENFVLNI